MMVVAGLGVAFLSSQPASGAASGWVGDEHASVRLVSAANGVGGDQSLQFGVQFRLAPGWHTYWRSPGDAGVPPVFDWSGSENVQNVTVAWPAPRRVTLLGLETFTYAGALVLPLGVIAFERGMHVTLRATIDYAACADICVPTRQPSRWHCRQARRRPPPNAT